MLLIKNQKDGLPKPAASDVTMFAIGIGNRLGPAPRRELNAINP
jgi:hypothetical protein